MNITQQSEQATPAMICELSFHCANLMHRKIALQACPMHLSLRQAQHFAQHPFGFASSSSVIISLLKIIVFLVLKILLL